MNQNPETQPKTTNQAIKNTFGRNSTEIGNLASVEYSYRACSLPSCPLLRSILVINVHSY